MRRYRARELSDQQLLADAWRELRDAPRATTGRASSTRTRAFSARYRSLCGRCGRWINRGDDVRFHEDFTGVVHSGCRAPSVTVKHVQKPVVPKEAKVRGSRLCRDCHLEHAGECL